MIIAVEEKLKPCLFCGSNLVGVWEDDGIDRARIKCLACGANVLGCGYMESADHDVVMRRNRRLCDVS
jgi:hypothetical protein